MQAKVTIEIFVDDYTDDDFETQTRKLEELKEQLKFLSVPYLTGFPSPRLIGSRAEPVIFNL